MIVQHTLSLVSVFFSFFRLDVDIAEIFQVPAALVLRPGIKTCDNDV